MIFVLPPILLILIVLNIKIKKPTECFENPLRVETTTSINAVFVLIIFFSHMTQYISLNYYDKLLYSIPMMFTQLVVVSFLFFSGYGIMESINKKGYDYVKTFPQKRLLKVWFDFAFALVLFIVVQLILGNFKNFSVEQVLLAFTGWTSIGNSSWYMFAIFTFYIVLYLSFILLYKKSRLASLCLVTILSVVYVVVLNIVLKGTKTYYYDTFLCLPAGMWFSCYKEYFYTFVKKWYMYLLVLGLSIALFILLFYTKNIYAFNFASIMFALILVLLSMKISISNVVLNWIGKHTFWIYILQRIPMIIFKHIGLANVNNYLFMAASLVVTILLSWGVKIAVDKLKVLIFDRKSQKKVQTV